MINRRKQRRLVMALIAMASAAVLPLAGAISSTLAHNGSVNHTSVAMADDIDWP
jgi:hypothetical protein